MSPSRRQQVWNRAAGRCEYCQLPQECDVLPFQLDHIRAQKHRGPTTTDNLAVACLPCNAGKGPNAAGYDPLTDQLVRLFNPRTDDWDQHFQWNGPHLVGRTPIGRATVEVLNINSSERVEHRRLLILASLFPPQRL
jgi:HNH endonuclease